MKWAVVVFPGSNCDEDAAAAVRKTTGSAVDLVWHTTRDLSSYDAIIVPGGFSYGDYLRCGAIAQFSEAMKGVKEAADSGKLVLGICNGFQVLTEAGLLPGGLLRNHHLQFRCELVEMKVENNTSPFTSEYRLGQTIQVPIAHGEGRYFVEADDLAHLTAQNQVAFTYAHEVNGSVGKVAGVLNATGNVLGLMPHPERAIAPWMGSKDGAAVFTSMTRAVEEGIYAY